MSVTFEMLFMIFQGGALLALIGIGVLLLRRTDGQARAGAAAPSSTPPSEGLDPSDEAEPPAPSTEEDRPDEEGQPPHRPPAAAEPAAPAPAPASEALAEAVGERVDARLRTLRDELEHWVRESATDAANRRIDEALNDITRKIVDEMRPAVAGGARSSINMQRPPAAAPPREPRPLGPAAAAVRAAAATAQRSAAPEPAAAQPLAAAPDPPPSAVSPAPATAAPNASPASTGVVISRPPNDAFTDASAWLTALGLDDEEKERLRAGCAAAGPSEVVRKLFTGLHKITSERRLAGNRPKLSWARVGEATLDAFLKRFHSETATLIWPSTGESFDPRTMLPVFKEQSGGGSITEVVAPGYSGETAGDAVKALVVY